jgi:endonuclease YncB( thermonuclease family)
MAQAADIAGKLRVIDGDTVDVGETRIRLFGVEAPEPDQLCAHVKGPSWQCSNWATQKFRDIYEGKPARCEPMDMSYERIVARCFVGEEDVGRFLVVSGLAYANRKFSFDYDLEEKSAAVSDTGLHGFNIVNPEVFRRSRIEGRDPLNPDCLIKGNINRKGLRIYHMPGQAFYERVGIRAEQGEQWFCSEAQARDSGWRAAKR